MTPHTPYDAEARCPNPYCENGRVRCEGGIAKGVWMAICRVCRGTGKAEGERG